MPDLWISGEMSGNVWFWRGHYECLLPVGNIARSFKGNFHPMHSKHEDYEARLQEKMAAFSCPCHGRDRQFEVKVVKMAS